MAKSLLHGTLHVTVYKVDRMFRGGCCRIFHKMVGNKKECIKFKESTRKLYVSIDLGNARVAHTGRLEKNENKWNESFHIYCAHMVSHVEFSIKEDDHVANTTVLGRAFLPVEKIIDGNEVDEWLQIFNKRNKPIHGGSQLRVKVQFLHVSKDSNWSNGIKSSNFLGVPRTYFSQREGCKVTLYQDAHVPNDFIPKISLSEGKLYEVNRCWEDIFDAIFNAQHLIYITGWSVYTEITLIRDLRRPKIGGDLTLGELLKKKANEGVRVLMLVWDDRTSVHLIKKKGLMCTHDEETEDYFRDTNVHCVLCPRQPDNGQTIVQDLKVATMFTHHQKIVVIDCNTIKDGGSDEKRKIVSFIGGLDLCDGRYDTPSHSNFRTLGNAHHNDFHQPCFDGASISKGGPREPWHDIHCKLEGPVAWDVLDTFEQRWQKQGGMDLLVKLSEFDEVFVPPSSVIHQDPLETWNVQLFRSIDGGAAFGFPESPNEATTAGLVSGKDQTIDRSVQDGYINAIRRAKRFIYIENQYFLGSSFDWDLNDSKVKDIGAFHLIPKELSLKIVSKIEAGERFTVYVVIPMWPEGEPDSTSMQAILNWQKRTMEMMYRDIVQALRAKGLEANPKDYLSFFCLGNREKENTGEYVPPEKPDHGSSYSRAQQYRRFMIYIHAKTMIVDDEYIIIGSANINQRSMDGGRDSEIAMGAYQPYHLSSTNELAKGQIHGLRMALWYEHLGLLDDSFSQPESLECVHKVNQTATKYWNLYSGETMDGDLPGHLLCYPIDISENGVVKELAGLQFFPDTEAPILGSKPELLPPILTT